MRRDALLKWVGALGAVVLVGSALTVVLSNRDTTPKHKALAELEVVQPAVDVLSAAGDRAAGRTGRPLIVGEAVQTGKGGLASVNYFDGSLTRVAPGSVFRIETLSRSGGDRRIATRLDLGQSWHNVQRVSGSESRFEVKTTNAIAAVRGTRFAVSCLPNCTYAVVDGAVFVQTTAGKGVLVKKGLQVLVDEGGDLGDLEALKPDPWVSRNRRLDAERASGSTSGTTGLGGGTDDDGSGDSSTTSTTGTPPPPKTDDPPERVDRPTTTTTTPEDGGPPRTTPPPVTTATTAAPSTTAAPTSSTTAAPTTTTTAPTTTTSTTRPTTTTTRPTGTTSTTRPTSKTTVPEDDPPPETTTTTHPSTTTTASSSTTAPPTTTTQPSTTTTESTTTTTTTTTPADGAVGDYPFDGDLHSDVSGAPDMTYVPDSEGSVFSTEPVPRDDGTVLQFAQNHGVAVSTSGLIPDDQYTVSVLFRFADTTGYNRILDVSGATSDTGWYVYQGALKFYDAMAGPPGEFAPDQWRHVVMSRDASGMVRGYVDGEQQLAFSDTEHLWGVIGSAHQLRFFRDDDSVSGEASAGAVARVRMWPRALSDAEVAGLEPQVQAAHHVR